MKSLLSEPLPLGLVVVTAGLYNHHQISRGEFASAVARHREHDWGDLCESDKDANLHALEHSDRIFSKYTSTQGIKFYVITEHDRSVTTLLLPSEY